MSDVRVLDQRDPDERHRPFLPGMGKAWLMPFYDLFTRIAGVRALHEHTVELAGVEPGHAVVDVGCGTGNLSFALLAAQPTATVTGLDPDGDALRRAARKARRKDVPMTLVQGYADRLPADDSTLEHVVSALALHHLADEDRSAFARDALRALRRGGKVTILDFGGPETGEASSHTHAHGRGPVHAIGRLRGLFRGGAKRIPAVAHNAGQSLVGLLAEAGFADAREIDHVDHRFGRLSVVSGTRP